MMLSWNFIYDICQIVSVILFNKVRFIKKLMKIIINTSKYYMLYSKSDTFDSRELKWVLKMRKINGSTFIEFTYTQSVTGVQSVTSYVLII